MTARAAFRLLLCAVVLSPSWAVDSCSECHADATCRGSSAPYTCTCNLMYKGNGTYCEPMTCEEDSPCHIHATCTAKVSAFECSCNEGYTGSGLSCTVINGCSEDPTICNENATCEDRGDGVLQCQCKSMFEGDGISCEVATCENGNRCNDNAVCSVEGGSFVCNCPSGYYSTGLGCGDVNECDGTAHGCHANATCKNTEGSYTCVCSLMFKGDGATCEEMTCEHDNPCHTNAVCGTSSDAFTCTCLSGFTGSGLSCIDIDECVDGSSVCHTEATCTNTAGAYTCVCNPGYSGTGNHCEDVNECAGTAHGCHANATCKNTEGSYTCVCSLMFKGDGATCEEMTCEHDNPCHTNAVCGTSSDAFTCTCLSGFTGSGLSCIDIDECVDGSSVCHTEATCKNTAGSYTCTCNPGYSGTGNHCEDINECAVGLYNGCHHDATCRNTAGSYLCRCNLMFKGNGTYCEAMTCEDDNPCDENAICVAKTDAFTCTCREGYTGSGLSCSAFLRLTGCPICPQHSTCSEEDDGGRKCICDPGYKENAGECSDFCTGQDFVFEGVTYSFNDSWINEVQMSNEICDTGRSIASITCIRAAEPKFDNSTFSHLPCTETMESVAERVDWKSADKEDLAKGMSDLNILVSSQNDISESDRDIFLNALQNSSSSLSGKNEMLTEQTLRDAVTAASSVTNSFKRSLEKGTSDNKTIVGKAQRLVHALEVFAGKVNATENVLSATSENIRAQVRTGLSVEEKEYHYSSQHLNVTVPREAVDKAKGKKIIFVEYTASIIFQTATNIGPVISIEFGSNGSASGLEQALEFSSTNKSALESQPVPGNHQTTVSHAVCAFYVPTNFSYSTKGCCLVRNSTGATTCRCDHLTSFAILVEHEVVDDDVVLSYVSTAGCILSIIGLLITILIHVTNRKICAHRTVKIFLHICSMLMAVYLMFLVGVPRTENENLCTAFAAILHYLLLAAWCWITVYSYAMYSALVKVSGDADDNFLVKCGAIAYGIPLLAVVITILINVGLGTQASPKDKAIYCDDEDHTMPEPESDPVAGYRAQNMCWLTGNSLKFGFILPAALLLLINYTFFVTIIRSLVWRRNKVRSATANRSFNREVSVAVSMATTLGLTWLFGYLMLISTDEIYRTIMAWLFSITNVMQGFMLFVFSVLRRAELRNSLLDPVRSHVLGPMASVSRGVTTTFRSIKHGAKYRVTSRSEDAASSSDGGNTDLYRENRDSVISQTTVS